MLPSAPRHAPPSDRRSRPRALSGARWSPPPAAGVAVLVLLAGVVALLVLRTAVTAPTGSTPVPPSPVPAAATPSPGPPVGEPVPAPSGAASAPSAPATDGGAPAAGGSAPVVVHVVGQVVAPGLVRLPAGARVADAVEAAGGLTGDADTSRTNLARPLVDGEQVQVPRPGEELTTPPVSVPAAGATGGAGGGAAGAAAPGGVAASGPVSLTSATAADLDALPGIGPVLAERILQWREEHGGFTSVDELAEVAGIGDTLLERLRPLVTV
ncbi:ComEA family DNA-binding protein [Quadrisphaera sp. DSM 44207]|uniref:ComEA family DNA-binding protein n=1 Tax=Quadrisphaera sp. DSM 44207 TaxID=1881057 RepID=UPI00088ADB2D|nr:ComEA family DNA-binding protein [Quadrisphaera sp. DSM 44207]SDQ04994.1 competence protein ComEA [Quadrisphaera sp. DSM 44207]